LVKHVGCEYSPRKYREAAQPLRFSKLGKRTVELVIHARSEKVALGDA